MEKRGIRTERGDLNREIRANPKERLQHLAAGTAGAAAPQGAGYGAVTSRAAGIDCRCPLICHRSLTYGLSNHRMYHWYWLAEF